MYLLILSFVSLHGTFLTSPTSFALPLPVTHSHGPFRGGSGGKRQINKVSFQSLCSQRGTGARGGTVEERGRGRGLCGRRLKTVALTRRDLCILLAKVKQIDPGCRFTCVFARLPVNLPRLSPPISVPRR